MSRDGNLRDLPDGDYEQIAHYRKAFIRTAGTPEAAVLEGLLRRLQATHPTTPLRLAYHEAGHVVMAHALGRRAVLVRRLADDNWDTLSDVSRHRPEAWCLLHVAGYLAEARAVGPCDPREASEVAWTAEELYGYGPDERRAYVEAIEAKARPILTDHWPAVERVAQLLLARLADTDWVGEGELRAAIAEPGS